MQGEWVVHLAEQQIGIGSAVNFRDSHSAGFAGSTEKSDAHLSRMSGMERKHPRRADVLAINFDHDVCAALDLGIHMH